MTAFFTARLDILVAFFLSMLPLIELRGGIPYAFFRGVPFPTAALVCFLGNLLPVPFILLFLRKAFEIMRRFAWTRKIVDWLERHARKRGDRFRKALWWGLVIVVALPIPLTGAWSGSLISVVFDMPMRKAFPAILLGLLGVLGILSAAFYLLPDVFSRLFFKV